MQRTSINLERPRDVTEPREGSGSSTSQATLVGHPPELLGTCATGERPGKDTPSLRVLSGFIAAVLAVFAVANILLDRVDLPDFAVWTGIRPLEYKLRLFKQFAAAGPVDAVVVGSSIADFGFSAEEFSALRTDQLGRPYRAFNFATGGAQLPTFARLYRLLRTVVIPRTLLIVVPPGIKVDTTDNPSAPDYFLLHAPVGMWLGQPLGLAASEQLWNLPAVRAAPALRDYLAHGDFGSRGTEGADLYWVSPLGDRFANGHETSAAEMQRLRGVFEAQIEPLTVEQARDQPLAQQLDHYFTPADMTAIEDLRSLAEADGTELVIVAQASAAVLYPTATQVPAYRAARQHYLALLGDALHARVVSVIDDFSAPRFATLDGVHLNHYGAVAFTRAVVAAGWPDGGLPPVDPAHTLDGWSAPDLEVQRSGDPTFNVFSALVARESPQQGTTLSLQYLQNRAVPPLPRQGLSVALRLPDGTDIRVPAVAAHDGAIEVHVPGLPAAERQVYIARLVQQAGGRDVAINAPLATYGWHL